MQDSLLEEEAKAYFSILSVNQFLIVGSAQHQAFFPQS